MSLLVAILCIVISTFTSTAKLSIEKSLEMPRVKLRIVEGYGTQSNPYIGGTEREVDGGVVLKKNEHIRAVIIHDFEADEDGSRRGNPDVLPVIPYEFINNLVGKVLTVSDASFSDKDQRRANKDLVTQAIWAWYTGQGSSEPS